MIALQLIEPFSTGKSTFNIPICLFALPQSSIGMPELLNCAKLGINSLEACGD